MTNQIRIFLGFLGLIALVSVFTFFNSFRTSSSTFLKPLTGSALEAVDQDEDKDGLPNRDESYWNTDFENPDTDGDGFLDGEEVASGHDPLKPGPDDFLLTGSGSANVNVTDKISTLLVSGFYAGDLSGSAEPEIYNKALTDIGNAMVIDSMQALNPNNINVSKIVSSSNSKQDQEQYLDAIGSIIQNDLWGQLINEPRVSATKFANFNTEDPQTMAESRTYFNTRAKYYLGVIDKLSAIPAPPSWTDVHQGILTGLQTLVINHRALGQTSDDPLKGIIAMNNLITLYQEMQPLLVTIVQKIKVNNLTPPNGQLWDLVNSLTDDF